jgi:hypothetical protein
MGDLFISITEKETPPILLDVYHCQGLRMMDICSHSCMGAVMERYDYEYKWGRKSYIYLGTLPSYF